MASPILITQTTSTPKLLASFRSKLTASACSTPNVNKTTAKTTRRREFLSLSTGILSPALYLLPATSAWAASDDEYVKDTEEVIIKVRTTITMEKSDPNIANAVADLREASNTWVAKYRREKALIGRPSFRDMYSALNAVSGHYISFGPAAPIPAKRKARILEEMDLAEKALLRGR